MKQNPVELRRWTEQGWSLGPPRGYRSNVAAGVALLTMLGLGMIGATAWMVSNEQTRADASRREQTQRPNRIEIWNVPARFPDRSEAVQYRYGETPAAVSGSVEYRRCRECGR